MTALEIARVIAARRKLWPAWKLAYKLTDYRTSQTGTVRKK